VYAWPIFAGSLTNLTLVTESNKLPEWSPHTSRMQTVADLGLTQEACKNDVESVSNPTHLRVLKCGAVSHKSDSGQ